MIDSQQQPTQMARAKLAAASAAIPTMVRIAHSRMQSIVKLLMPLGLLVIAAQDEVGGLFIRQPTQEEQYANWEVSAAGAHEDDDNWVYVPPQPNVFTVFTGDMMQYITKSELPSTPHKVGLNTRERFAFAYFHEPNFSATLKTFPEFKDETDIGKEEEGVCYGKHFTNMFMRNYPERITAKRMIAEKRMEKLDQISQTLYPYKNISVKL